MLEQLNRTYTHIHTRTHTHHKAAVFPLLARLHSRATPYCSSVSLLGIASDFIVGCMDVVTCHARMQAVSRVHMSREDVAGSAAFEALVGVAARKAMRRRLLGG